MQALKTRLDSTQGEASTLHEKLSDLTQNIDRMTQQYERSKAAEGETRQQADRFSSRVEELEEQNTRLQERLSNAQRMMTNLDHDNRILQVSALRV